VDQARHHKGASTHETTHCGAKDRKELKSVHEPPTQVDKKTLSGWKAGKDIAYSYAGANRVRFKGSTNESSSRRLRNYHPLGLWRLSPPIPGNARRILQLAFSQAPYDVCHQPLRSNKVEEYQSLIQTIALTMGVAWASGINLYAAVGVLGLGGSFGYIDLPAGLEIVQDPMIILAACVMYCVEFMADKTPGVDSGWDALHTFIRIPAGAMLAAGAVGDVSPALIIAGGLVGGSVTAATHATKAGSRVLINTSPEPFSNWGASILEDVAVFAGLWAALQHPVLFLAAFAIFVLIICWLLPKLWRGVSAVFRKVGYWLGIIRSDEQQRLHDLNKLANAGILNDSEYQAARTRLVSG
jgi:hypothetical protein